jgi:SAM-dependent methyltransferase
MTSSTGVTTVSSQPAQPVAIQRTSFDALDAPSADATSSIPQSRFDEAYYARPPWDIDGPQPAFVGLLDSGVIRGRVLDVGCGTGENALCFASRGLAVTGIDGSALAIARARTRAHERALPAHFLEADALHLTELGESFDTVTDSGLLHVFSDEQMQQLIAGVHTVLRAGGRYCVLCFSERATHPGPRRLTREALHSLFSDDWSIESLERAHFEVIAGRQEFTEDSAAAWLAVIERV